MVISWKVLVAYLEVPGTPHNGQVLTASSVLWFFMFLY
jgi:hypothetical protein